MTASAVETVEQTEVPTEHTPEETQEEKDFASGFEGQTEEPSKIEASENAEASETPPTPEPAATPDTPAEPELAKITTEQFNKLMATATDLESVKTALEQRFGTAFGKLGSLEQVVKQLQASTPVGEQLTISADDLDDLKKEYPDLAELTAKGLTKALGKLKGTAPVMDPAILAKEVDTRVKAETQRIERDTENKMSLKVADLTMPGWRKTVTSDDFSTWLKTQPADYQQQINDSWEPTEIKESIDKFNAHQAAQKTKPKTPPANPRRAIVNAGVTPKGSGVVSTGKSDDQEFADGFYGR